MTGMAPAFFLFNVAELNLEVAEQTFDAVGSYASPSGNYPEVALFAEPGHALNLFYSPDVLGEMWARHRQWEGAITAEALLHYLVGFRADAVAGWIELAPHLPHDAPWLEVRNLRVLDHPHHLRVESGAERVELTLTVPDEPSGYGLQEVRLRLTVNFEQVSAVRVDDLDLSAEEYAVISPYTGALEVRLDIEPRQGETTVTIVAGP